MCCAGGAVVVVVSLGSHFIWPLCIHRRRGKQAKVTSGRQVYTSRGWFVYVVWWWEQRVVDADSKVGISSSYFMCACVSACSRACARSQHVHTHAREREPACARARAARRSEREMKELRPPTCTMHLLISVALCTVFVSG